MTKRRFGGLLAAVIPAAIASAPSPSHAAEGIDVDATGCALRSPELERLVKLELGAVAGASPASDQYRVAIECTEDGIHVVVTDPLTNKRLERTVLAPAANEPEPERLIALTVAQLYRASWLELVAEERPALRPARPPARSRHAITLATEIAKESIGSPANTLWSLAFAGGVRVRHAEAAIVLPHVDVSVAWSPSALVSLSVRSGFEWGVLSRSIGSLAVLDADLGAVLAVEPLHAGAWSGFAEVEAAVAFVRIEGVDPQQGYEGSAVAGPGFDGSAGIGAALRAGPVRFELAWRGGFLYGTPRGIVQADDDLALDGGWTGVDLRIRIMP